MKSELPISVPRLPQLASACVPKWLALRIPWPVLPLLAEPRAAPPIWNALLSHLSLGGFLSHPSRSSLSSSSLLGYIPFLLGVMLSNI